MKSQKGFILLLCMLILFGDYFAGCCRNANRRLWKHDCWKWAGESQEAFWLAEAGLQDAKDRLNGAASVNSFLSTTGFLNHPVDLAKETTL